MRQVLEGLPAAAERFVQPDESGADLGLTDRHLIVNLAQSPLGIEHGEEIREAQTIERESDPRGTLGVHARLHEPVEHVLLLDVAHERPFDVFDRHQHCLLVSGEGRVGAGIGASICARSHRAERSATGRRRLKGRCRSTGQRDPWGGTLESDDTADEEAWIEIRGRNTDIDLAAANSRSALLRSGRLNRSSGAWPMGTSVGKGGRGAGTRSSSRTSAGKRAVSTASR